MKYLILGASAAGLNAVRAIREIDSDGDITVVSKDTLVHSRPLLCQVISGERLPEETCFVEKDFFERNNVRRLAGLEAVGLDTRRRAVRLSNGSEERYHRLLIATGASSFLPPIENMARGKQVFGLRNLEDALAINRIARDESAAAVIGAGPVGMEAAYALQKKGVAVSVIEVAGGILSQQLDRRAAGRYEDLFREHGVKLYLNNMAASVALDADCNVRGLHLKGGQFIPCGMVIVAAGVRPNTGFLEGAPVAVGRGIKVDRFQRTSVENVYAAGDVCESLETFTGRWALTPIWPSAVGQGRVAGYNMAGMPRPLEDNFAYKNSMTFFGLPSVSFGCISPPDGGCRELSRRGKAGYKRFVLKNGRILSAIFQGEIANAGLIGRLIRDGIDITGHEEDIFDLTYAHFFAQKENGEFYFPGDQT